MQIVTFIVAFLLFLSVLPVFKPVFAADILINEFVPNPVAGDSEWVEFYNTTNSTVDLSDYFFDDDTNIDSDSGSSVKVALSGILPASQTCFWELSSYLNNNGDSPTLFKIGSSTFLDTYTYSSSSAGLSYVRIPDGGSWNFNQTPSKSSNKCIDSVPTATLTPIPTASNTPTKSLTPTPTIKLTSSPTPLPSPTKTPTPKPTSSTPSPTQTSVLGISQSSSQSVLGDSDEKTREQTKAIVPGESKSKAIGIIFIFLGVIFLSLCGIVFFLSYRNSLKTNGA